MSRSRLESCQYAIKLMQLNSSEKETLIKQISNESVFFWIMNKQEW